MPGAYRERIDPQDRALFLLSGLSLSVAFITGGSSQENGWGLMAAELLALAVLLAVLLQTRWRHRIVSARWGIAVAGLIVAIPLLQLLPIPTWLWQWPAPRLALRHDLAAAGVTGIEYRWSLAPAATERDLLSLLPGVALFVAALALRRAAWRGLLWWVIGLIVFSLALAFAQLGVPQDSFLNPFPQYVPALAGVFANRNHQACALAMGLVLALTMMLGARAHARHVVPARAEVFACALLVAFIAVVLPLVNSRAGVIIGIIGVAATLLTSGAWSPQRLLKQRGARWLFAFAIAVLALGLYGAFAWMQQDVDIAGSRWQMTATTAQLAAASMPLGTGVGSFVRMFEQATQGALMHQGYINAAHDDYVQWWLAGGVLAIVAMLAATALLLATSFRLLQLPPESPLRSTGMAALLAVFVPLLHSTVDYPLRTPALMTAFGMLSGIAVAAALRAGERAAANPKATPDAAAVDGLVTAH